MSIKAYNMNKAIVSKLEKVLDNTEFITDMKITIHGHSGEAPMITYEISELIVTTEEETT